MGFFSGFFGGGNDDAGGDDTAAQARADRREAERMQRMATGKAVSMTHPELRKAQERARDN